MEANLGNLCTRKDWWKTGSGRTFRVTSRFELAACQNGGEASFLLKKVRGKTPARLNNE